MSNNKSLGLWLAAMVGLIYLGIWLFCKLTGQKAELPS